MVIKYGYQVIQLVASGYQVIYDRYQWLSSYYVGYQWQRRVGYQVWAGYQVIQLVTNGYQGGRLLIQGYRRVESNKVLSKMSSARRARF